MKPALLILDAQNDFFGDDNPNLEAFHKTVPHINAAIQVFREEKRPFCFIQHTSHKKSAGSHAWKIAPVFEYEPKDWSMNKSFPNAFWETDLEKQLRSANVNAVIIAGYISEHCVLSTYRGAQERGFQALILEAGIASLDNRNNKFVLKMTNGISLEALFNKQAGKL